MDKTPIGRFAPTPSGRMHLGNVFAGLIAWLSVKSRGGAMVLRMEDLDTLRTSQEFAQVLREDLTWLGLTWDVETPPQSQRSAVYDQYFEKAQTYVNAYSMLACSVKAFVRAACGEIEFQGKSPVEIFDRKRYVKRLAEKK